MRPAGLKRSDRAVRWGLAAGALLMAVGVACGEDADNVIRSSATSPGATSSALAGTWVTAPGFDDVTMVLQEDGAFTWDNRTLNARTTGTWTADATTLTFTGAEDESFCPGETLTWEYQLDGDRLTSEVVALTCPELRFVPEMWEFQRQPGS